MVAGAGEPVRPSWFELGRLDRSQQKVVVPEDQTHPAGQDVQPLVPLMRLARACCSWPGR